MRRSFYSSLLLSLFLCGLSSTNVGCSNVTAPEREVIKKNASNCSAINSQIQKMDFYTKDGDSYNPAPWVKEWWNADERAWNALNAWANKEAVTK